MADVEQAIAKARKWRTSPDNGWAPNREEVGALVDEIERLRAGRRALLDACAYKELGPITRHQLTTRSVRAYLTSHDA